DPASREEPISMDFSIRGIIAEKHLGLNRIAITPFDHGITLSEGGYLLPIFWAKLAPGFDLPAVKAALKDDFAVDKPNRRAMVGRSPEENAFRNGVRACALLSLLLGLYIIFNSMSMSLVERIRQIGLLRAMGLTRTGLTGLFLVEGFILTMAGCVISVFFAAIITGFMAVMNITTLGTYHHVDIMELPWLELALIMVLGTVFSLLGVIYPVGKASNLSVIQAIRKGTIEFERQPFKGVGRILFFILVLLIPIAYYVITPMLTGRFLDMFRLVIYTSGIVTLLMGLLLFFPFLLNKAAAWVIAPFTRFYPVAGRLAESSMSTSRLRVFSTVSGLALVFAAIFVIAGVTDSLENETQRWADRNLVRNIYLRSRSSQGLRDEDLQQISGVQSVMNLSAIINAPFPVRAVDTESIKRFGPMRDQPDLCDRMKTEDLIIISTQLAKIYDYKKDDQLSLSTPLAGRKVFRICAIADEYGFFPHDRHFAAISREKMVSYFCVDLHPGVKWCLHLEEGASVETVCGVLSERLGNSAQITSGPDLKKEWIWDLRGSFAIFYIIITLVALLSGVSILNSLVIAVVERRRETALLRVVGLTPKQLQGILLMEAYSLGTLGGLFGLILGIPIAILTVAAIKTISNLDLQVTFSVLTVLMTFFGALLVSVGASIYPMIRQSATDLMEAVKIE
ncbi:MAG: FtsX-like permease family protein, partial [Planctomycetota bacterium]